MKALLFYLLQVIVTSGILYGYYHFALRNKRFHRYNRFYLLAATVASITIPFLNIPVYFTQSATDSSFVLDSLTFISSAGADNSIAVPHAAKHANWLTWQNLTLLFYCLIAFFALLRIIFSLLKIRKIIAANPVEELDKIHFINTTEPGTPFSFFRWLFWNKKIELHSEQGEQIFRHELFHIEQKHSWDIIYTEILSVIFWINPFFHLLKKELKTIHEFLADRFAVSENSKWQYAELLLMQALHTNQKLVNPFFHNQIKRRITMITTSKKPGHQYFRKMMVLPLTAVVVGLFAFSYKEKQEETALQNLSNNTNAADTARLGNSLLLEGNISLIQTDTTPATSSRIVVNGKAFTVNKFSVEGADNITIQSGNISINTLAGRDTTAKPLIVLDGQKQLPEDEILKRGVDLLNFMEAR
ncbi:MAG: M56 family metallopeptidase, partial [Bacteroidota bacterium]